MKFNIDEILTATSGYIFYKNSNYNPNKEYEISGITTMINSPEDTIYLPNKLKVNIGVVDSFTSIEHVLQNGVRCFFFDEIRFGEKNYNDYLLNLISKKSDKIDLIIMVSDTMLALRGLAEYTRYKKLPKNVKYAAITGSIGKTSTTEMLYYILSVRYKAFRGEPTCNIRYRIMHKFLEAPSDVEWMIFECSGQLKGYLADFSQLLMPDIAIVTKIANENLGEYRTFQNLAKEKSTIISSMSKNSVAVLNDQEVLHNASEDYICKKIFAKEGLYQLLKTDNFGSEFIYKNERYHLPVVGVHQIDNAIKAIELTKAIGFTYEEIKQGLSNFVSVGDRWVVDKFENNVEFVTDCPNNPSYDTLVSGINTFMNIYKNSNYKRIIISRITALGDFEYQTYIKIAKYISKLDIQELICVGVELEPLVEYIKNNSSIKVTCFAAPKLIDDDAEFIKYLVKTMYFEQATLIKAQGEDGKLYFGNTKDVLKKYLKLAQ